MGFSTEHALSDPACPEIPSLDTTVAHAVDKQDLIYSQSQ